MLISEPPPMEQELRVYASLDFIGERLEPNNILPLIPLKASHVSRKGEPTTKRPPRPGTKTARARVGTCFFSTDLILPSPDINEHVAFCFAALRPRWVEIAALREAQGFRIEIACFSANDREKALWILSEENERLSREFGIEVENETSFNVIPRRRR